MNSKGMVIEEIILEHGDIRLAPLDLFHEDGLLEAASDGQLWELWYTSVPNPETLKRYIEIAIREKEKRVSLPFVVIDINSNKVIGSTRYMNIDHGNRRLEIGATWYANSYQRTGTNTTCKFLLLQHAFEKLGTIAVEFRTHFFNHRSRDAIERLGAKRDGVLRNHRIDKNGLLRDTVVYSILNSEWPVVKKSLQHKLKKN